MLSPKHHVFISLFLILKCFSNLSSLDKEIIAERSICEWVPSLSQDTDIWNVHCELVNDSLVDGSECHIIYSFSTSVLRPSCSFTLEPRRAAYNPVNKNNISSIRIYITDGKQRIVNLNGADTAFSLILKTTIEQYKIMKSYEFTRIYQPQLGRFV